MQRRLRGYAGLQRMWRSGQTAVQTWHRFGMRMRQAGISKRLQTLRSAASMRYAAETGTGYRMLLRHGRSLRMWNILPPDLGLRGVDPGTQRPLIFCE